MGAAPDRPLRTAVVGLGYWGPNLVRALHEVDGAEAVAVCDLDASALERIARRYPALRCTTSLPDLLADETIDAIVIATPVRTHFTIAAAALASGKHVFIEKPLAASSGEAEQLVAFAEAAGVVLMPGHTFLYSPPVMLVKDLIASGELGQVYFVSTSRVNLGLHQPDVSVVWDLGPHDFSILLYWLEDLPVRVSAVCRGCIVPDIPDVAFIDLEYASGTIAHVELAWLAPSKLRRTTVVGSEKMIVYDDTSNEPVRLFDAGVQLPHPGTFGEYRLTYRTGDIVSPRVQAVEPLVLELDDFCTAVRQGTAPRSSAELGMEVVRLVESVDESLGAGGAPVELGPRARAAQGDNSTIG